MQLIHLMIVLNLLIYDFMWVDEVGRGSLAGPVISVAYCCKDNTDLSSAKTQK